MKKLITFLLFVALFQETANAATYYVNIGLAAGTNDGSSWNNAFQTWSAFTAVGSPGVVTISRSGAPFVTSAGASWNTGSTTITLSVSNPLILVGDAISGTGLASNTTVTAISGTTLTLSLATTATVTAGFLADAVVDNIYIKGNIPSQSSLWVVGYLDNFYGSCYGTESSPNERPMNDNDVNGIIEPWEFLYPTTFTSTRNGTAINGSSAIFDGFTITHTGAVNTSVNMTTYISPIGQTIQNCVFTGSNLSYGATTAYTNGNGGCLLKVLGTFKNNLIEKNNVSLTYVTTATSSTDIKVVPYLEVNFPATNNIVVSVSGCIFRNNKATITNSGTAGTTDNLRGMVFTTNHPNTAGLTGTSATYSDCIVHNNEISYTGTIMPGKSSIAGSLVLSSSSSKDNFINCTFANNKMTNMATCFYATSTGNVVHKVYNNALWNNKNTVTSTSTTSTVSMSSQSSQNASTVFNNNYMDVAAGGSWGAAWGAGNVTNFSASNTGSNGPYFKKPPMNGANNIIGAFQSAGTELTSINLSDWRLNPGTYLNGKGITTTILKDKAGIDYSSTPSVGAYEYVKVTPTVTINVSSYIYNGSNEGPNSSTIGGTVGGVNSTGILSYIYSESGNSTLPINAGNYSVTATLAADTYYNSVSSSATSFSLSKKPLTIGAPSIASKVYDGSTTSGTVTPGTLSGFVSGETVTVNTAVGTYPDANVETGKTATIVYTLANGTGGGLATNYSLANGSANGDITAATLTLNNAGTIFKASDYTIADLANSDLVVSAGEFNADRETNTVHSVTVAQGAKLSLGSNTLSATNGITLQSNSSSTATLVDNYSTATLTATVQQYLPQGRNWYVGSPIETNVATTSNLTAAGATSVSYYSEQNGWQNSYSGNLAAGVGYVVVSNSGTSTNNISITGKLNSGNVPVTLTKKGSSSIGYNLIANPYPSYINPMAAINANSNLVQTIWYRTKGTTYKFETVNTASGVGTNASGTGTVTGYIPPMQAFWIRTNTDNQTLTFTNTMRNHANPTGVTTTALKAPKQEVQSLARIKVVGNMGSDEAILYFNVDASNGYDKYDSPKMFESAAVILPEIYTQAGSEKLVINGLNAVQYATEIPLGFVAKLAGDYNISSTEISNFEAGTKLILKDKLLNLETILDDGVVYNFSSKITSASNDRFSLIFQAPGTTTSLINAVNLNANVYVNIANQIVVSASESTQISIYNSIGQIQYENELTSTNETIEKVFGAGIYFVALKLNGQSKIQKIIIR
jgi:hypothetical protein